METRKGGVSVWLSAFFAVSLLFFYGEGATASPMQGGTIGFYLMNQKQLGLSPDQISRLQAINRKFQKLKEMENVRIKVIHLEGMKLLMQKDVNTGVLKKDIDRVLQHKKNIMTARVDMLADAHKVLTNEQFSRIQNLWRQMMNHEDAHPVMGQPPVAH
jgi:hypothetical protein